MTAVLNSALKFPDPRTASTSDRHPGLLAIGGDLSTERLVLAYRSGIFPWSAVPITWWSPDPRGIFELDQFHVSRSLKKVLNQCELLPKDFPPSEPTSTSGFGVTIDRAFRQVIEGCAWTRTEGNWISPPF